MKIGNQCTRSLFMTHSPRGARSMASARPSVPSPSLCSSYTTPPLCAVHTTTTPPPVVSLPLNSSSYLWATGLAPVVTFLFIKQSPEYRSSASAPDSDRCRVWRDASHREEAPPDRVLSLCWARHPPLSPPGVAVSTACATCALCLCPLLPARPARSVVCVML